MLEIICVILALCIVFCLWVMLYDTHHFVVVKHVFTSPKIKKDTRLVMLSDLHNCQYGRENEQLFSAIRKAEPDYIVLVGDMITAVKKEKFDKTLIFLKRLTEICPVYYAYGNHEQKISLYPERYGDMGARFEKALSETGVRPLRNAHTELTERGICLYGLEVEHAYYKRFETKPMAGDYLEKLLGKCSEATYSVLLAHNPEYFPEYADWGAKLVLSGHIHGGIIRVPFLGGFLSPAIRFFPKYDGGLFWEKESAMVLGRGIGTHTPRVRLFNPAELLVIDLKEENR